MEYDFKHIESKWQEKWEEEGVFHAVDNSDKPKFYGLVEFPYPSGAGMHVGHIKAYSGLEVVSRKRRLQGYNVLFPIGFDAYGLPTENYAIKTGIHPRKVTDMNIKKFTSQLKRVGFSFDWTRVIDTTEEGYYKWTQWIFLKMFENGLAFRDKTLVNYCPSCKVVLSNEDSQGGKCDICHSEVVQKSKDVWYLRITEYADKLLEGLKHVDYLPNIKAQQEHWIGKSRGAFVNFSLKDIPEKLRIYTTRPDTLFGVTFMVIAPEHPIIDKYKDKIRNMDAIVDYRTECSKKTEFERTQLVKDKTGVKIDGLTAINPVNGREIPVYISDYVMMGYGTGAIMAVPAHDDRDYDFAKKFGIDIIEVIKGGNIDEAAYTGDGEMVNSGFLNGMDNKKDSIKKMIDYLTEKGIGEGGVQYKMKDWAFNRQRYWGEPFPVYYKDGMPQMVPEDCLPLLLPEIETYKPTETGEPPLGRAKMWAWDVEKRQVVDKALVDNKTVFPLELNTMPGFAGSSAYYLRYMDPHNDTCLVGKDADNYWQNVDLYVGGCEHATGHLIYSRFWNKFLFDLGVSCKEEPYQKLVNQGMIQGRSNFVYRVNSDDHSKAPVFVSYNLRKDYDVTPIHVDVNIVSADVLDIEAFKAWRPEYANAEFVLEDGKYICGWAVEKMSKSMYNVVNPDQIVRDFGADTLRMYEMFLGPLEQSKPWDTNGIDGVHKFLRRFWRMFFDRDGRPVVTDGEPTADELKALHKTIKKVTEDIENFSFNTSVSAFMICQNELGALKCTKRAVLEPLAVLIAPFAPHIAEQLWSMMGHATSVCDARYPEFDEKYLVEDSFEYPVMVNGKLRFKQEYPLSMTAGQLQADIVTKEEAQKWLEGATPKKIIVVHGKIINIVK